MVATLLELAGVAPAVSPGEVAAELRSWLLQELDMRREAESMARLHRLAREEPWMVVPCPYRSLCGPRVVTAERVRAIALTELLDECPASGRAEALRAEQGVNVDGSPRI